MAGRAVESRAPRRPCRRLDRLAPEVHPVSRARRGRSAVAVASWSARNASHFGQRYQAATGGSCARDRSRVPCALRRRAGSRALLDCMRALQGAPACRSAAARATSTRGPGRSRRGPYLNRSAFAHDSPGGRLIRPVSILRGRLSAAGPLPPCSACATAARQVSAGSAPRMRWSLTRALGRASISIAVAVGSRRADGRHAKIDASCAMFC